MLFLNKEDLAQMDQHRIQNAVLTAYELMNSKKFNMPDRIHVQDKENTLLLMPCFGEQYFATKLVSVFPNAAQKGLPVVNGLMTLADNGSGIPLAVMDGAAVTAERTGAVGGLGVRLLTDPQIKTAGIFGAGVQGFSQVRYLMLNRDIQTLLICDINTEAAQTMADNLSATFKDVDVKVVKQPDDLVELSELVIAATTSPQPLFSDDHDLVKGKTFISIGSFRPEMKEFPDAVITCADKVFVDTLFAAKESGDICQPLEKKIKTIEDILPFAGLVGAGRSRENTRGNDQTLFFKSVGMALFDLTVASAIYNLALETKTGTALDF
ncbi:MAG: ornithine cyclodeaminase family protein [Desulfobacter sp.]|nr:ornithine cyclodeaminase family protein [Desulfobacter sp.]WDP85989.1 MAG: ornithine cyclodeaminase family protein [Desulfobacter sp.]